MSIQSWMAEFYPVPADEVSEEYALAHSLKKWEGLRQGNLDKHGVERTNWQLEFGVDSFPIDNRTCALCIHYENRNGCPECPLTIERGASCCMPTSPGLCWPPSPWAAWVEYRDPEPMITLIKDAIENQKDLT